MKSFSSVMLWQPACLLFAVLLFAPSVMGQTVLLRGEVTDQNGALIPGAKGTLNSPSGLVKSATADGAGRYSFGALPAGDYVVNANAPNLALPEPVKVTLRSGVQTLNLQLHVVLSEQQVTVLGSSPPTVSTESGNNASATVL